MAGRSNTSVMLRSKLFLLVASGMSTGELVAAPSFSPISVTHTSASVPAYLMSDVYTVTCRGMGFSGRVLGLTAAHWEQEGLGIYAKALPNGAALRANEGMEGGHPRTVYTNSEVERAVRRRRHFLSSSLSANHRPPGAPSLPAGNTAVEPVVTFSTTT